MVSSRQLSRLASARNRAEQAGLDDTAERIDVLRRELCRFHELPSQKKASTASWAIAKADETVSSMAREIADPGMEAIHSDRRTGIDIVSTLTKVMASAGTLFTGLRAYLSHPDHPGAVITASVLGLIVLAGIIDHAIGPKNPGDVADVIRETLDELKAALEAHA